MVQAVENLSAISGSIHSRRRHYRLEEYDTVSVQLERADAVPGKAKVLESQQGATIDVAVRRELLGDAEAGARLRCRAKRTPDGAMCEPHPHPSDFEILAPEAQG